MLKYTLDQFRVLPVRNSGTGSKGELAKSLKDKPWGFDLIICEAPEVSAQAVSIFQITGLNLIELYKIILVDPH